MKTAIVRALAPALLALVVSASGAVAATMGTLWSYVGNTFDPDSPSTPLVAPYTTSNFVTASFLIEGVLPANRPFGALDVLEFTLNDGVQTITQDNAVSFGFNISTTDAGAIDEWFVIATGAGGSVRTYDRFAAGTPTDAGFLGASQGRSENDPGMWTSQSVMLPDPPMNVVPVPAALPLYAGLVLLGGWDARRRARAA
jgi:hypothetical protein